MLVAAVKVPVVKAWQVVDTASNSQLYVCLTPRILPIETRRNVEFFTGATRQRVGRTS